MVMSTTSDAILFEILEVLREIQTDLKRGTDLHEAGATGSPRQSDSEEVAEVKSENNAGESNLARYMAMKELEVSPQHLEILRLTLTNYVNNYAVTAAGCKAYLDEMVSKSKAIKTINNNLTIVGGYCQYKMGTNPAKGLKLKGKVKPQDQRSAFTKQEVDEVLDGLLAPEDTSSSLFGRRWIPVLMAFSGARPEEVAQLRCGDVKRVTELGEESTTGSYWVFDFRSVGEGQRHKTDSSRRLVPVHQRLWQLGFDTLLNRPVDAMLFPELNLGASGRLAEAPSRYFNGTWLRMVKRITDSKKTLYSLRHSFATELKHKGVDDVTISELLGHTVTGETSRYAKSHRVDALDAAINRLDIKL
jgi:integrase